VKKKFQDVNKLLTQGLNKQVVIECGSIIEQALEELYKIAWVFLNPSEKQKIVELYLKSEMFLRMTRL